MMLSEMWCHTPLSRMADLRAFFRRVLDRATYGAGAGAGSLTHLGVAETFRGRFIVAVWLAQSGVLHVDVVNGLNGVATPEDVAEIRAAMRDTLPRDGNGNGNGDGGGGDGDGD